MKTCKNCRWEKYYSSWCDWAREQKKFGKILCPGWRPRPWTIVLKLVLSALVLVLIACGVWAYLDQSRIDATSKDSMQATDYTFTQRVYYTRGGREHWRVGRTVVWTIYNCAGERGYFISEGGLRCANGKLENILEE